MSNQDYCYLCNDRLPKWKKYLLLVDWGLITKERLLETIRRYPIYLYSFCLDDIEKDILYNHNDYTYIIKLVYKHTYIKLPNIRIASLDDLEKARMELSVIDQSLYSEIWYCKNLTKNQGTVFGRMMFNNDELFPRICPVVFELVWSNSARMIEKLPEVTCPYIALYRDNWNTSPVVMSFGENSLSYKRILNISEQIISSVSRYTSDISKLGTYVFSLGCNSLCLEFKYHNDEFEFIDWDSDNDYRILHSMNF